MSRFGNSDLGDDMLEIILRSLSARSQTCLQHNKSRTSVANIDVAGKKLYFIMISKHNFSNDLENYLTSELIIPPITVRSDSKVHVRITKAMTNRVNKKFE